MLFPDHCKLPQRLAGRAVAASRRKRTYTVLNLRDFCASPEPTTQDFDETPATDCTFNGAGITQAVTFESITSSTAFSGFLDRMRC
jgi:hypothetical protein